MYISDDYKPYIGDIKQKTTQMDYDSQIERLHEIWGAMDLDSVSQLNDAMLAAKAEFEDLDETEVTGIFYEYVDDLWDSNEDELDMDFFDEDLDDY